jgi:hypothetical protein
MNVIRVTKLNDDGSVAFDGLLGPNEVRYILENGLNFILQTGVETIEEIADEGDEDGGFTVEGTGTEHRVESTT